MRRAALLFGSTIVLIGNPALARTPADVPTPAPIQRLLSCRSMADAGQRLACYDRESGSVSQSFAKRDLVAFDREKVRSTKRTLFGLTVPNLGIFGDDGENEVRQVEGVLAGVGHNNDGGWTFRLQDGARWSQQDGKPIALEPRSGDKVLIKRGVLGSYTLSVAGQPGVKVKRVN